MFTLWSSPLRTTLRVALGALLALSSAGLAFAAGPWVSTSQIPSVPSWYVESSATLSWKVYAYAQDSWDASVGSFSVWDGVSWTVLRKPPTARYVSEMYALNWKIYIMGGYQVWSNAVSYAVEEYDPVANTWTTKAAATQWISEAVVVGATLYRVGSKLESFDGTSWTTLATPNVSKRASGGLVVSSGSIYLVGGRICTAYYNGGCSNNIGQSSVERYSIAGNTWNTVASMPKARYSFGLAAYWNKLYVSGGRKGDWVNGQSAGNSESFSDMIVYDTATNTWSSAGYLSSKRTYHAMIEANGKLYIVGGIDDGQNGEPISTVETYDTASQAWATTTPLNHARYWASRPYYGHFMASTNKIIVVGGFAPGFFPPEPTAEEYVVWPPPAATLGSFLINGSTSATFEQNHSGSLSWNTTNATSCAASGTNWTGTKPDNSSSTAISFSTVGTYTLSLVCSGPGGSSATKTVSIRIITSEPAPQILSFTTTPQTVYLGSGTTSSVSFSSSGAHTCDLRGPEYEWVSDGGYGINIRYTNIYSATATGGTISIPVHSGYNQLVLTCYIADKSKSATVERSVAGNDEVYFTGSWRYAPTYPLTSTGQVSPGGGRYTLSDGTVLRFRPEYEGDYYTAYPATLSSYDLTSNIGTGLIAPPQINQRIPMVAAVGTKLYVIGGSDAGGFGGFSYGGYTGTVQIYNKAAGTWSYGANMPVPWVGGITVVWTKIYVATDTHLQIYNTTTNSWTSTALPESRIYPITATVGTDVYVIGGWTGGTYTNRVDVYNTSAWTWSTKTNLPAPRRSDGSNAISLSGVLYVFGSGTSSAWPYEVLKFNSGSNTWSVGSTTEPYAGIDGMSYGRVIAQNGSITFDQTRTYTPGATPPVYPAPTATFTANPTTLYTNDSTSFTWSSAGAASCTWRQGSGASQVLGWDGDKALSGSQSVGRFSQSGSYDFILTCDSANNTSIIKTVSLTVNDRPVVPPPTALTGVVISQNGANIYWTNAGAYQTKIYYQTGSSDGTWANPYIAAAGQTGSYISILAPATAYYFKVNHTDGTVDSTSSNIIMLTTPAFALPAPLSLTGTNITQTGVDLLWNNTPSNLTTRIYYQTGGTSGAWTLKNVTSASGNTGAVISGLSPSTTYGFQVRNIGNLTYRKVAAGAASSCALTNSGTLQCWGFNRDGQLGTTTNNGTTNPNPTPTTVPGLSGVADISSNDGLGYCALMNDATVKCWGLNSAGQLGTTTNNGTTNPNPTPTTVPGLSGVIQVAAAALSTCALMNDATVKCWWGGSGDPTPTTVPGLSSVSKIANTSVGYCALMNDATVKCWWINRDGQLGTTTNNGNDNQNPPTTVPGLASVVEIAGGYGVVDANSLGGGHFCARMSNGTVKCWWDNGYGQLGTTTNNGNSNPNPTPTLVPGITTATAISASALHTCILLQDTTVKCVGRNMYGELGTSTNNGTENPNPTPTTVPGLSGVSELRSSMAHTCARLSDQSIQCWWDNTFGELGRSGSTTYVPTSITPTIVESDPSNSIVVTTQGVTIAAPTNLTASLVTQTGTNLYWTNTATGRTDIYYQTGGLYAGSGWTYYATASTGMTGSLINVLRPGTMYGFRVEHVVGGVRSAPSEGIELATKLDPSAYGVGQKQWPLKNGPTISQTYPNSGVAIGDQYYLAVNSGSRVAIQNYDPELDTWSTVSVTPSTIWVGLVTAVGQTIYIFDEDQGALKYDLSSGTWTSIAIMPTRHSNWAISVVGSKIYVFGWSAMADARTPHIYNTLTNSWSTGANSNTQRYNPVFLSFSGKLYAIGGENTSWSSNSAEVYNPATNTWTNLASMSTSRRFGHVGAVIGGKVYVVGGVDGSSSEYVPQASLEIYDIATNTWSTGAAPSLPRNFWVAALLKWKVYIFGGSSVGFGHYLPTMVDVYDPAKNSWGNVPLGTPGAVTVGFSGKIYEIGWFATGTGVITSVRAYSPATNTWTSVASLNLGRANASAAVLNGKIYVAGGDDPDIYYGSGFEVYDPLNNTWTVLPRMPYERSSATMAAINGKLYIAGWHDRWQCRSISIFNPSTNAWTNGASAPVGMPCYAVGGAVNGKLYLAGGYNSTDPVDYSTYYTDQSLYIYNTVTNSWSSGNSLPLPREWASATVLNGQLYVLGGYDRGTSDSYEFKSVMLYDPPTNRWTYSGALLANFQSYYWSTTNLDGRIYLFGGQLYAETFETVPYSPVQVYAPWYGYWSGREADITLATPSVGIIAPLSLTGTNITQTGVTLRWTNTPSNLKTRIYYQTGGTGGTWVLNNVTALSGATGAVISGLTSNTNYGFQVRNIDLAQFIQNTAWANHTCALKADSTVWCWGRNDYNQLWDWTTTNRGAPVQVTGLTGAIAEISAGDRHTCARKSDNTVWCWGENYLRQLGDWTNTDRTTPVQVTGLTGAIAEISADGYHTCARKSDNTVWCWGWNMYWQLWDGTSWNAQATPVQVTGLTGAIAEVSAGFYHTCARKSDNTVWCWWCNQRNNWDGTTTNRAAPTQVISLTGVISEITSWYAHTCARKADNTIWCWGNNGYWQLGDGTNTDRTAPNRSIALTGTISEIFAGANHTCARKADNTIWCWGRNDYNQLWDQTTTDRINPVQVTGLTGAIAEISAGDRHTCARKADNTIWCWGMSNYWQLWDGTYANGSTPIRAWVTSDFTHSESLPSNSILIRTLSTAVVISNFRADPNTITSGGTSTLRWTATGATSCTITSGSAGANAPGGTFTGATAVNGGVNVSPTSNGNKTYTLVCNGVTASPNATLQVNGSAVNGLCWSASSNAGGNYAHTASGYRSTEYCAQGDLRGAPTLPAFPNHGQTITWYCDGRNSGSDATCTAYRDFPPPPTVSLSASPTAVELGQSYTLTWSSTGATGCVATSSPSDAAWNNGSKSLSGTQALSQSSTGTRAYTLTCSNAGGSNMGVASVTVGMSPPTSLYAAAITQTGTNLYWTSGSPAYQTRIEYQTGGTGGTWVNSLTAPAGQTGALVSNLSPATTYYFRVRHSTGSTYSDYSNLVEVITLSSGGGGGGGGGLGPCGDYTGYSGPKFPLSGLIAYNAMTDVGNSYGTGDFNVGNGYLAMDRTLHGCFWHSNVGWSSFDVYGSGDTHQPKFGPVVSGQAQGTGAAWGMNVGATTLQDFGFSPTNKVIYSISARNMGGFGYSVGAGWMPLSGVVVGIFTPMLVVQNVPNADAYTSTASFPVLGYTSPGATITALLRLPDNSTLPVTCTTGVAFTCTVPGLTSLGTYTLEVTANYGEYGMSRHTQNIVRVNDYTDATVVPVLVVTSPQAGLQAVPYVLGRGLVASGTIVSIDIDGTGALTCTIASNLTFNCPQIDLPDQDDHTITVTATDSTNGTLRASETRIVRYDAAAPRLTVISPVSGYTNGTSIAAPTGTGYFTDSSVIVEMQHIRPNALASRVSCTITGSFPAVGWNCPAPTGSPLEEGMHTLVFTATDSMGRVTHETRVVWVDRTAPTATFICPATPYYATDAYELTVYGNDLGGSPIASIVGNFESDTTNNSQVALTGVLHGSRLSSLRSIKNLEVDTDYLTARHRVYTANVTSVSDAAGNTAPLSQTCDITVVPDLSSAGIATAVAADYINVFDADLTSLASGTLFADGSNNPLRFALRDQYGNDLISNNATGIPVTITLGYSNTDYLDQQSRTGNSAVAVVNAGATTNLLISPSTVTSNFITPLNTVLNGANASQNHDLQFQVFAPTALGYSAAGIAPSSDPDAQFTLASATVRVQMYPGYEEVIPLAMAVSPFAHKPLVTTAFDTATKRNGIIIGNYHNGFTEVPVSGATVPGSTTTLASRFGSDAQKFSLYHAPAGTGGSMLSGESCPSGSFSSPFHCTPGTTTTGYRYRFEQNGTDAVTRPSLALASHLRYTIGGRSITINGDTVGASGGYWSLVNGGMVTQIGLNVAGAITGRASAITAGQIGSGVNLLGDLDTSVNTTNLRRNALTAARGLSFVPSAADPGANMLGLLYTKLTDPTPVNGQTFKSMEGTKFVMTRRDTIDGNTLIVSSTAGTGTIVLDSPSSWPMSMSAGTKRTLLVIGADLYIGSNIQYADNNQSILGIVVISDDQGRGGNIYIDSSVTNISATIYAQRAVMSGYRTSSSATSFEVLDGSTDIARLSNQLDVYGSLIAANTIGGSSVTPLPLCPNYVLKAACTVERAQRYDLNYLRRYYLFDTDGDGDREPANGGLSSYASSPILMTQYGEFPVVIRFNPTVQVMPPPLFMTAAE